MLRESSMRRKRGQPRVVGMGLLALDVVFGADDSGPPECFAGGTCGNVLTVLSFLGWWSDPVSRLGEGQAAELLVRDLRRWNVSEEFIWNDPKVKTPVVIERITRSERGEPRHRFSWRCPFCGEYLARYRPVVARAARDVISEMDDTAVFFFDRVSRGALVLAKACSDRGAVVVFEPSARVGERRLVQEALALADIVKYSGERVRDMGGLERGDGGGGRPVLEIETLGSAGLRYRSRLASAHDPGWVECAAIPALGPKDAAGAGDWCTAGLVDQLCRKGKRGLVGTTLEELRRAVEYGQALASWACGFEGARGGMYEVSRADLEERVERVLTGRKTGRCDGQNVRREREEVVGGFCASCTQPAVMAGPLS